MKTMTLEQVRRAIGRPLPDGSGAFRDVYFLDDLVVKADWAGGANNEDEIDNYKNILHILAANNVIDGITFRVPEMTMVDKYLIAERVREGKHLVGCPACEDDDYFNFLHDRCDEQKIIDKVSSIACCEFGLIDMHGFNFFWIEETKTAILIDLGA